MKITLKTRIKTKIHDAASGAVLKESPWRSNLVMDQGLNFLAKNPAGSAVSPASSFTNLIVGGGTNPTSTASGGITFTQSNGSGSAGNILAASAGFFTSGMVGTLFKWGTGTGGVETYITGFTDSTHVTVDTNVLIVVPAVGTVWHVNQTGLQTYLHSAGSYQTNTGDNSTTFSAGQVTFQRTFIIPIQSSTYSVNEIGWNGQGLSSSANTVNGRIVLSSTDVVGTTNFYVVVVQLIFNYSPAAPTAVVNVGTSIDTSGNAMIECLSGTSISFVQTNGTNDGAGHCLDGSGTVRIDAPTVTYSQNGTPGSSELTFGSVLGGFPTLANFATTGARGTMTATFNFSTTTSGQTIYGFAISNGGGSSFDVKFTTPFVTPTGVFSGAIVFQIVYDRVLSN